MPSKGGFGRALGRDLLDGLLLDAARAVGAEIFQPWRAAAIVSEGELQAVTIEARDAEKTLRAPVVIAAHGSWEPGKLPSQLDKINDPSNLLGFKAHFKGASLPPDLMPLPIYLSHRLVERQAQLRKSGKLNWLRPDAKSQVTIKYVDGKPKEIDTVVLSTQHHPEIEHGPLCEALAVSLRGWIARLDRQRQRHECRFGRIQRIGELFHAQERGDAGAKLLRVHRLG